MNSPNGMHIRDARDDERMTIRDLTLAAYAEYARVMTPSAWKGLEQAVWATLSSDEPVERIVAEQNGTLVGSVWLYPAAANPYGAGVTNASYPEIRLLAVLPAARGQGIATALMRECMARARRGGASELGLHTSESMRVAIGMYERMGFVRAPAYDFHPPGAEVVKAYRLRLTDDNP